MSEHANIEEIRIEALLEARADAVRRHDVRAILAHLPYGQDAAIRAVLVSVARPSV